MMMIDGSSSISISSAICLPSSSEESSSAALTPVQTLVCRFNDREERDEQNLRKPYLVTLCNV